MKKEIIQIMTKIHFPEINISHFRTLKILKEKKKKRKMRVKLQNMSILRSRTVLPHHVFL